MFRFFPGNIDMFGRAYTKKGTPPDARFSINSKVLLSENLPNQIIVAVCLIKERNPLSSDNFSVPLILSVVPYRTYVNPMEKLNRFLALSKLIELSTVPLENKKSEV
jgi:hypothetical protein